MHRTRIKICGITRGEDVAAAVSAGADALGVVLAPSKRQVTIEEAARVLASVPPLVACIGVFVDADAHFVAEAVRRIGLAAVQFHGDEPPEACLGAPVPVIKALRVGPGFDMSVLDAYRGAASGILLDTMSADAHGGTGVAFDWQSVAGKLPLDVPLLLAGGLCAVNVGEAIRVVRPFAVDVSSGVEVAPGVKDPRLMHAFIAAVRAVDLEVDDV